MRRRTALIAAVLLFTLVETFFAAWSIASKLGLASQDVASYQSAPWYSNFILSYSTQFSVGGWSALALIIVQGKISGKSRIKGAFLNRGLGSDVYELMVGMRGGTSRLALLQSLETPRHRQELAEITGIDWKEVDRETTILEKYGLVKMYAQSGSVKLYQTTEQGQLLVKLLEELNNGAT